jgi:hypothetical protein
LSSFKNRGGSQGKGKKIGEEQLNCVGVGILGRVNIRQSS